VLDYLQNLALAEWVRSSPSLFAYSTVLTAHGVGLGIVVGVNTVIALRLLGVARDIPLAALRRLYGMVWIGSVSYTHLSVSGFGNETDKFRFHQRYIRNCATS